MPRANPAGNAAAHARRPSTPLKTPDRAIRLRVTLLSLLVSLVVAGFCTPLLKTVYRQLLDSMPEDDERNVADLQAVYRAFGADRSIVAVDSSLRGITRGDMADPRWPTQREMDPRNGLYDYLELLVHLRSNAVSSRPAHDATTLDLVRRAADSPPVHLYAMRLYEIARDVLARRHGSDPESPDPRACTVAQRVSLMSGRYRPPLRELSASLNTLATRWRTAGRTDDARLAQRAVLKLHADLLQDSPTPDIALLASEAAPPAMAAHDPRAVADAAKIGQFRSCWDDALRSGDHVSIIPMTGEYSSAGADHDAVIRTFSLSLLAGGMWLMTLLAILLQAPSAIPARARGLQPAWRTARAMPLGVLIAVAPLLVLTLSLATMQVPWAWLFSARSLAPVLFLPLWMWIALGLATRFCAVSGTDETAAIPVRGVWLLAMLPLLAVILTLVLLPVRGEPWRPPAFIQMFRKHGVTGGWGAVAAFLVWTVWGFMRRRRAGTPVGTHAQAVMALAARSLVVISLILFALLAWNQSRQNSYAATLARTTSDPVTARLGASWKQEYFGGLLPFAAPR